MRRKINNKWMMSASFSVNNMILQLIINGNKIDI